jgi:NitT/TauT family transport system substrate-binding protein
MSKEKVKYNLSQYTFMRREKVLMKALIQPSLLSRLLVSLLCLSVISTACGLSPSPAGTRKIRVGYFPNITHSQALIGISRGDFQKSLSPVEVEPSVFNAGPSVIEALFAGQIDLSYIGPNPAINGYVQSQGKALRIIAGATSGGAAFVVRPDAKIQKPADLEGKKIATPQLGNTQDVALRAFLVKNGLNSTENGGTVQIIPTENPLILDLMKQGQIDGAWVPEPWASRLIVEAGAELFIDERSIWPGGQFVTANIIVSNSFLENNPDIVKTWLATHVDITLWEQEHPDEAMKLANAVIQELTGKPIASEVLEMAWSRMDVTYDPLCTSLYQSADNAYAAGFLKTRPDLAAIYDLDPLNEILLEKGFSIVPLVMP